jgi:hypothetical protein
MVIVKAMPGLIPAPNSSSGSLEKNKKNIGSQMGQTDKKHFKNKIHIFKERFLLF